MKVDELKERELIESQKIEKALRESEDKYRILMNDVNDAIILIDSECNILEVNTKTEELLDYSKEEILNKSFTQLIPIEELKISIAIFREIIKEGSGVLSYGCLLRKDGKKIFVNMKGSVINYRGKKVIQGIFKNVMERKKLKMYTLKKRFQNI